MSSAPLSEAEIAALIERRHAIPHALLGLHPVVGGVIVRALLPEACAVVAVPLEDGAYTVW